MLSITPTVQTIDEVIEQLGRIVAWAKARESALGYFPCLYRRVTIRVKEDIAKGRFEDGPRMEQLDVIFANRYFEALHTYWQRGEPTRSWQIAFEVAETGKGPVLRHLLLGMNAHINLDLGLAAARVSPGDAIESLRRDFLEISNLLAEMINDVQDHINTLSPVWKWLDHRMGQRDEWLAEMNLRRFRRTAWKVARDGATCDEEAWHHLVAETDHQACRLANRLYQPRWMLALLISAFRLAESGAVRELLEKIDVPLPARHTGAGQALSGSQPASSES